MRVDKIEVMPMKNLVNPEMGFEIELYIRRKCEIPLVISGCITSDENNKIANIYELIHEPPDKNIELSAIGQRNEGEDKLIIKVNALLHYRVLDYIETLRTKNPKDDVIVNFDIFVQTLMSNTVLSDMFLLDEKPPQPVLYEHRDGVARQRTNMWVLSGDGSPTFIKIRNNNFKKKITIPSSGWIHDYCPVFNIGNFLYLNI